MKKALCCQLLRRQRSCSAAPEYRPYAHAKHEIATAQRTGERWQNHHSAVPKTSAALEQSELHGLHAQSHAAASERRKACHCGSFSFRSGLSPKRDEAMKAEAAGERKPRRTPLPPRQTAWEPLLQIHFSMRRARAQSRTWAWEKASAEIKTRASSRWHNLSFVIELQMPATSTSDS